MADTLTNSQDKDALKKDAPSSEQAAVERSAVLHHVEDDGKTPSGNDPNKEFFYEDELDPSRLLPVTGYPYLDQVEKQRAELQRAAVEGREPDLENPGPTAGTPLKSFAAISHPMNRDIAASLAKAEPVIVADDLVTEKEALEERAKDEQSDVDSDSGSGSSASGSTTSRTPVGTKDDGPDEVDTPAKDEPAKGEPTKGEPTTDPGTTGPATTGPATTNGSKPQSKSSTSAKK